MTLEEAFRKGIEILKNAGNEAPAEDAGALLCSVLKRDRVFLYTHAKDDFDKTTQERYLSMLKSRADGMPLQYLTGVQEFMSLPFEVGHGVLVPRQDTEILVETVINIFKEHVGAIEVLDIGTGSGCIAVSLAFYLPESSVTAVDKMSEALNIAKRNAITNGVEGRVQYVKSNLYDELTEKRFDVIVSNPPYIRTEDIIKLQREVRRHEPMEALNGGNDGLDFYRAIIKGAPGFLKDGGIIAFETGYDQAADVAALMKDSFNHIRIYKDLAGIERVVTGYLLIP